MPLGTGTTALTATPRPNIPSTAWGAQSKINMPETVNRGLGGVSNLPSRTNTRPQWGQAFGGGDGGARPGAMRDPGFGQRATETAAMPSFAAQLSPDARRIFQGFTPLQRIAFQQWIRGLNAQRGR